MPPQPAIFQVLVLSTTVAAALLLWCWLQNRHERALIWAAAGYAGAALGNLLFAGNADVPGVVSGAFGVPLLIASSALIWVVARTFNGRPAPFWVPLAGPVAWLAGHWVPGIDGVFPLQVAVGAVIIALYVFMAAWEFWRHDGLRSRYPIALALAVHGIAVTLRIPVGIWANDPASAPLRGVFVTPIALEAVVFIQVFAFLLVSLAKERVEAQLRVTALTDALTGLPNRRALLDRGAAMLAAAARSGGPVAVVVFDLDRFKDINDSFGHPVGDAVLRVFADATRSELRAGDCAGRIGGEEFAAVLTDADEAAAATAAERIMAAFTRLAAAVPGLDAACTTSAGIAAAKAGSRPTIDALLTVADRGLYDAKRAGGNVVRVGLAA